LLADITAVAGEPSSPVIRPEVPSGASPLGITKRQQDVLELIVRGLSNKEIARELNLGEGTVKVHVAALFRTLGVTTRSAAAAEGARRLKR
jgi:DNA-binding NarL/FixJ family response regulator